MFKETLEEIFTKDKLLIYLNEYSKHREYEETKENLNKSLKSLLNGTFIPKPLKSFSLNQSPKVREIAISSLESRVIQKVLINAIERSVDFSDKSYAYRKNKGTLKAINRVKFFLNKYHWIVRFDIESFFDNINQEKLKEKLNSLIKDKRVVKLILLFVNNGVLKKMEWIDRELGIHQGDNISPFLSNLYLNEFDKFLEQKSIDFVRFGDDVILFGKHKKDVFNYRNISQNLLELLGLNYNKSKSYISNIQNGFEYLGLYFKNEFVKIENSRLDSKVEKIKSIGINLNLSETIEKINEHILGIKRYYAKIISEPFALNRLQKIMEEVIINKIVEEKETKRITQKSKIKEYLDKLESYIEVSEKDKLLNGLVNRAYELLSAKEPLKEAKSKIEKSKYSYEKNLIKSSEIILSRPALTIGASMGKITIKEQGKVIKSMPSNFVTRIVVLSRGISLSSNLIEHCAYKKIDIDFIYKSEPYAMISYFKHINNELHLKQLEVKNSKKSLALAKEFLKAKSKNQINLIKYYDKRRDSLEVLIEKMEVIHKKIPNSKSVPELMGYEGSLSSIYWSCFGEIISTPNFARVTKSAVDGINQALNYGYAILYHRIQSELLKNSLNIYTSFLHEMRNKNPTLVYDLIEEFRQLIVDREVISIINKGFNITTSKGLLTNKSKEVVTKNIQERLSTYTRWREGKYKMSTIIEHQANLLARSIRGDVKYRGFVGRI